MTRAGAVITLFVALGLAGLGYFAYLKKPGQSGPAAEWARSIGKEQILPVIGLVVVATLVSVAVGVYRHHRRGSQAWADFAAQLGLPCHDAGFLSEEPSRIAGEVQGRAFLLETRVAVVQTSGGRRSSVHTDMKLELRGAPEGLTVTSATAGLGAGLLGGMVRGLTDKLIEGTQVEQHKVLTGDARFDGEARAFCPDQEAGLAWLDRRTEILIGFLQERGCSLGSGQLIHSTRGKADSVEELSSHLARLSSLSESLEAAGPPLGSPARVVDVKRDPERA